MNYGEILISIIVVMLIIIYVKYKDIQLENEIEKRERSFFLWEMITNLTSKEIYTLSNEEMEGIIRKYIEITIKENDVKVIINEQD